MLRGPNVMKGYYQQPQTTAEALRNGWLHTGDLGYQDDEGFFYLVDRVKDGIFKSGVNIYPREVEEALLTLLAVAEATVVAAQRRSDQSLPSSAHWPAGDPESPLGASA